MMPPFPDLHAQPVASGFPEVTYVGLHIFHVGFGYLLHIESLTAIMETLSRVTLHSAPPPEAGP